MINITCQNTVFPCHSEKLSVSGIDLFVKYNKPAHFRGAGDCGPIIEVLSLPFCRFEPDTVYSYLKVFYHPLGRLSDLNLTNENCIEILKLCEALNDKKLASDCLKFALKNITVNNFIEIFERCDDNFDEACENFLHQNCYKPGLKLNHMKMT